MKLQSKLLYSTVAVLACLHTESSQAADVFKGKSLYTTHCQACHGASGKGRAAGTPNFRRSRALMKPDSTLFQTIADGRKAMPGYFGVLSEEEILDVIAHLRTML